MEFVPNCSTDFVFMRDSNPQQEEQSVKNQGGKKPFVEPEIKEFDDLEKQIRMPLIGTFTP
jgi:hypothetical protein